MIQRPDGSIQVFGRIMITEPNGFSWMYTPNQGEVAIYNLFHTGNPETGNPKFAEEARCETLVVSSEVLLSGLYSPREATRRLGFIASQLPVADLIGRRMPPPSRNSSYAPRYGDLDVPEPPQYSQPVQQQGRPVQLRQLYVGRTPGKNDLTGRQVIQRMEAAGKIRRVPDRGLEVKYTDAETGITTWVPINQTDMAHNTDAVRYWNTTGRFLGPKHPEIRKWMLDPANYELVPLRKNRSDGAKLKLQYLPPVPTPTTPPSFRYMPPSPGPSGSDQAS